MVENYFKENDKVFSLKGILGRRDFIVNTLIIEIIKGLISSTPIFYMLMSNPKYFSLFGLSNSTNQTLPLWWLIWFCITGLVYCSLYFSSIVRRVRDIIGVEDDNRIYLVSTILSVLIFMGYTPIGMGFWGQAISLFILFSLIFMKGKISSEKPKNNLLKFNWGAFFGTWIWGLFNKTPITLLMLPLMLTLSWFPFMLVCGLKGNQWAAKNMNCETIEEVHISQEKQSKIWLCLFPILLIFFFIFTIGVSSLFLYKFTSDSSNAEAFIKKSQEYLIASVESNFTKIELAENENKFYIDPLVWSKLSPKYRKEMLRAASDYVIFKTLDPSNKEAYYKSYKNQIPVRNKTKIYSSFNNEILAEFYLEEDIYTKELRKASNGNILKVKNNLIDNAYKINNNPTLP